MFPCSCRLSGNRSASSSRWLARAKNDPFRKGRPGSEGTSKQLYVARSAYKLAELNGGSAKTRFIRPGARVLELGAAPGGWTQYCLDAMKGRGKLVAVDLLDLDPSVLSHKYASTSLSNIVGDAREQDTLDKVAAALSTETPSSHEGSVDVVLSDMLANTTGNSLRDGQNSLELCQLVFDLALRYLRLPQPSNVAEEHTVGISPVRASSRPHRALAPAERSVLVMKIFQSQDASDWRRDVLQKHFKTVRWEKPAASVSHSLAQPSDRPARRADTDNLDCPDISYSDPKAAKAISYVEIAYYDLLSDHIQAHRAVPTSLSGIER